MTYHGIDYSGPGSSVNRDPDTGIRYGILSANETSLIEWFWDSVEPVYKPRCPNCGSDAVSIDDFDEDSLDGYDEEEYDFIEYACKSCELLYGESGHGDEPDEILLSGDDVEGIVDGSNDIWVFKSEFYTRGTFCSPCAPGAVSIGSPCEDGPKAYCLGPDWFKDNMPPYPVWSVATDKLVSEGYADFIEIRDALEYEKARKRYLESITDEEWEKSVPDWKAKKMNRERCISVHEKAIVDLEKSLKSSIPSPFGTKK